MTDAFFAGRVFAPGEQDGFKFLLWGDYPIGEHRETRMTVSSTFALPFQGSFLCELETGWLLVAGVGRYNNLRHTFFDDSSEASENARAMQNLGIPILTKDEGNHRVKADGVTLYSITGEEKRRADALTRNTRII